MKDSHDTHNLIVESNSRFLYNFNRGIHEDFPSLIVDYLTKLKTILGFNMILIVQPLMMDNRLESFVSGPGADYSSLGLLRNMNYEERVRVLRSLTELSEYSDKNNTEYPMFDKNIFKQVIAYPIKNIRSISEINGGIYFLNKKSDFVIDDFMKKSLVLAGESIAAAFNSYRKNQQYLTSYSIFQSMQQSTGRAVCVYSPRGVIVFINKYFAEMVGRDEEDLLNKNIMDVFKLKGHSTVQDYHFFSDEPNPKLPKEEDAMYCQHLTSDGRKLYLRKYCSTLDLERKKYWMIVLEDLESELRNIDFLEMSGNHDTLTGLGNRSLFKKEAVELFNKDRLPMAVIVGDVNGLKLMNDIFGHDYGDHMLKNIARILEKNCANGSVYRIGGDEFNIFLNNTDEIAVREIIEKINDDCSTEFKDLNFIGISLGYSIVKSESDNLAQAIRKAESDMYYIKSMSSESIKNESISSLKKLYQDKYSNEKERTGRLKKLAEAFGPSLNLRESEIDDICNSIELIDIGKVSVSHFLPDRSNVTSEDEFENMKKHCWIGYKIAALSYETSHLARVILNHHENWDGTGFPQGIKGNAIPFLSRVIRIMAYYDGLVNRNHALGKELIINELDVRKGKLFDPSITDSFVEFLRNISD
ncbi:MAG: diguanylate cyclase [Clostridia bacterium]|nr:diguanylate cyclase [Clostridia bacterium]